MVESMLSYCRLQQDRKHAILLLVAAEYKAHPLLVAVVKKANLIVLDAIRSFMARTKDQCTQLSTAVIYFLKEIKEMHTYIHYVGRGEQKHNNLEMHHANSVDGQTLQQYI
jgi:hypothetical protein